MRLLLDTHCWLWVEASPEELNDVARRAIASGETDCFLSAASAWEISIKVAMKKLRLPEAPAKYVPARLAANGISEMPITSAHALHAGELPPHHRDPFDRLLVAQSRLEAVTLVTADPALLAYDVDVLRAGRREPPSRP